MMFDYNNIHKRIRYIELSNIFLVSNDQSPPIVSGIV